MRRVSKVRKLNRLPGYDYSQDGFYFMTICVDNYEHHFGHIKNGVMCLNQYGSFVWHQWQWLKKQYPYIKLHSFITMPNHVHGIIEINKKTCRDNPGIVPAAQIVHLANKENPRVNDKDNPRVVPTERSKNNIYMRRHNLLSKTVNAFKTTTSKYIHQNGCQRFKWQRSFYDHIIKNEKTFNSIQNYIINNPVKWNRDRNNIW